MIFQGNLDDDAPKQAVVSAKAKQTKKKKPKRVKKNKCDYRLVKREQPKKKRGRPKKADKKPVPKRERYETALYIRVPLSLQMKCEAVARSKYMSISQYMRTILIEALEKEHMNDYDLRSIWEEEE